MDDGGQSSSQDNCNGLQPVSVERTGRTDPRAPVVYQWLLEREEVRRVKVSLSTGTFGRLVPFRAATENEQPDETENDDSESGLTGVKRRRKRQLEYNECEDAGKRGHEDHYQCG
ncbi:hypothetical protein [Natronorubrum texcoconense]|uniref:hypothetical protein n=1 Tax=Natronorubrum texcoconense TaxID=1095776 RepID=UPI0011138744|nr:hypothetical protein [Natronorubrum texcoconense]